MCGAGACCFAIKHQSCMKSLSTEKFSGNEVHCMILETLRVTIMLCSKLHCQKNFVFSYKISLRTAETTLRAARKRRGARRRSTTRRQRRWPRPHFRLSRTCLGVWGLTFKAHRLLYHSTLGSRLIKKQKKKVGGGGLGVQGRGCMV